MHGAGNIEARLNTTLAATQAHFEGVLGLEPEIWVALLGAYSVGGAAGVGNAKAVVVPFDATPAELDGDHDRCLELAGDSAQASPCPQMRSPGGAHWFSPTASNSGNGRGDDEWMILLDTDLSMVTDPALFNIVKEYAHSPAAFAATFEEAMLTVSELGYQQGELVEVWTPTDAPAAASQPTQAPTSSQGGADGASGSGDDGSSGSSAVIGGAVAAAAVLFLVGGVVLVRKRHVVAGGPDHRQST